MPRKRTRIATTVVIAIEQGLADVAEHQGAGCRVIIRDYDIDGAEPRRLVKDRKGNACIEQVFKFPTQA